MRIAYVSTDAGIPVFGHKGCAIHVRELCAAFTALGAEVTLCASGAFGAAPPSLRGVEVIPLPARRAQTGAAREREAVALNRATIEALTALGPFDLVYERAALWSVAGPVYAARTATPSMLEVNAPLVDEQIRYRTLVYRRVAERLFQRAAESATAVVAVSAEVAAHVRAATSGRARVDVVANGVAMERFAAPVARRDAADRFTVGFLGSLKPWHGVDTLIEAVNLAAARVPRLHLLIVGDGPERESLALLVAARGLTDRVTFTGAVAHEDVPALLRDMDVATAPYPALDRFYFSPLKVLEYMASGRTVVASDIGQIRDLVADGVTGRLVPPGDPSALADALVTLAADPIACSRLGAAARAFVANGRTWRDVAQAVARLAGVSFAPALSDRAWRRA
ncbi:MAG: glycosyltransferase family 4 protein [Acidobacteriota bacterium]|nr:glycosyltransferase family 4 protein [Acidobacteriota bacterium]